jgi:pyruvate-formate lyase-activating enzyme
MAGRRFEIVLIKPSRYDDDGYVVQWHSSILPSNSLASVYGLLADCAAAKVLGLDVEIRIEGWDECNTVIDVKRMARRIRDAGSGFVGLVGVQSNQYPRALDLARRFRAAGVPVVIGGFHVSGCISMLPTLPPDLQAALDLGCTLYAGEGEGRMADLLRDIDEGGLKPVYNYMNDLPDMAAAVTPILPRVVVERVSGHYASFDAGRGCPFQCSFCTIINVQGRKSRHRTADDVEAIVRQNAALGITRFFVTDDNFARNRNWEPILDRLIQLRESGMQIRLLLQVDTLCHKTPRFIEKAARAGCNAVYIGLENINPESLAGVKKRQNKIWEYREMLQMWRAHKVMTWAGYILGFPTDTPESIARDIEIIKRELPLDILEFFCLTPLPGSEDHKVLYMKGVPMDPDMNKYDLEHICTAHPIMAKETWHRVYVDAFRRYYTDEHVATVLRRAVKDGLNPKKVCDALVIFSSAMRIEGVHPLQFGFVRKKVRTERRFGMPLENPLWFYPRRLVELAGAFASWMRVLRRYRAIMRRAMADPAAATYMDEALRSTSGEDHAQPDLIRVYSGKIPQSTYGAPTRQTAA